MYPWCSPLGPGSLGDDACETCLANFKKSIISATAASCIVSNFLMGVLGNLPLAVAPAMGLNAYFAYTVVGFMGTGPVSYEQALTAVFVEGFIFIAVSLIGVRSKIVQFLPRCILLSTSAGIGLFLAFIGLQQSEGIGLVTYNSATLVTLGGCPPEYRSHMFTFNVPPNGIHPNVTDVCTLGEDGTSLELTNSWPAMSGNYQCASAGVMRSATMWLGIMSGMLMVILMAKEVKGAMIIGILFATFISWIPTPSNQAAYIGQYSTVPGAQRRYDYFKQVVGVPNTSYSAGKFDWSGFSNGNLWVALITFLYVDFFDATGTLFSMANFLSNYIENFVDQKTKRFARQTAAYCVDGVSIVVGACLGTSPLTVYIESASGIREGARTGIASLVMSFGFFVCLFFAPLISAIPPYATGPALVLVGSMMVINLVKINRSSIQESVPAFLTMALMPLTYSIAYGFLGGILSWIFINLAVLLWNVVHASLFWRSFPDEAKKAGGGSPFKAAWWLTGHPPGQKGLLETVTLPPDTEATLHARTFRIHEGLGAGQGAGVAEDDDSAHKGTKPAPSAKDDVEAAA